MSSLPAGETTPGADCAEDDDDDLDVADDADVDADDDLAVTTDSRSRSRVHNKISSLTAESRSVNT